MLSKIDFKTQIRNKLNSYHLSLSFNVGGLNPLFDMRNSALMGWRSNIGGCSSASSMAVMPTAHMSHNWLYPPFLSTAATYTKSTIIHKAGNYFNRYTFIHITCNFFCLLVKLINVWIAMEIKVNCQLKKNCNQLSQKNFEIIFFAWSIDCIVTCWKQNNYNLCLPVYFFTKKDLYQAIYCTGLIHWYIISLGTLWNTLYSDRLLERRLYEMSVNGVFKIHSRGL